MRSAVRFRPSQSPKAISNEVSSPRRPNLGISLPVPARRHVRYWVLCGRNTIRAGRCRRGGQRCDLPLVLQRRGSLAPWLVNPRLAGGGGPVAFRGAPVRAAAYLAVATFARLHVLRVFVAGLALPGAMHLPAHYSSLRRRHHGGFARPRSALDLVPNSNECRGPAPHRLPGSLLPGPHDVLGRLVIAIKECCSRFSPATMSEPTARRR
jgi:hypothetical protein